MPRRLVLPLLIAVLSLAACTSSGGSSGRSSGGSAGPSGGAALSAAVSSALAAAPSPSGSSAPAAAPGGRWTKQVAAQQFTAMLTTYQRTAEGLGVSPQSSFDEVHKAVTALSGACAQLVTAVRNAPWPAAARDEAKAFVTLQDEECTAEAKLAAAATADEFKAVPRLPQDHSGKLFDARRAFEVALGL